jgi:hypothetical protein
VRVTLVDGPSRSKRRPAEETVRALRGAAGRSGKTQRCHKLLGVPESRCALGDLCRLFHRGRGDAPAPLMRRLDKRLAPRCFPFIVCRYLLTRATMRTLVEQFAFGLACIGAVVLLYTLAFRIVHQSFPEFLQLPTSLR